MVVRCVSRGGINAASYTKSGPKAPLIQPAAVGAFVVVVVGAAAGNDPQTAGIGPSFAWAAGVSGAASLAAFQLGEAQLEPGFADGGGRAAPDAPADEHAEEGRQQPLFWLAAGD